MPDFYLVAVGAPTLETRVWEDPASSTLPSRIGNVNERQHRRLVGQVGVVVTLQAILNGQTGVQPDTVTGMFTMWAVEFPTDAGQPMRFVPVAGMSSLQRFTLNGEGHYTLAVRHEDVGGTPPQSNAGGVILYHVDVEGVP